MPRFPALLLSCLWLCLPNSQARTFTDTQGHELEGTFIELRGNSAVIRRDSDQRNFLIPLDNFCSFDQHWIKEQVELSKQRKPGIPEADKGIPEAADEAGLGEWPDSVQAEDFAIDIVKEDLDTNKFVYRSKHFEFRSNVKLARKVVHEFAAIFENTLAAVEQLPIRLKPKPPSSESYFVTELYETYEQYLKKGGLRNSAGVYKSSDRVIMIPLRSLGLKKASSTYTLDKSNADHSTLIHEITHQVMHEWLRLLPIWLIEGLAVYVEHIPYERDAFHFDDFELETFWEGSEVEVLKPQQIFSITAKKWNEDMESTLGLEGAINYRSAWLYTCYFLYHDESAERLFNYLRALEAKEDKLKAQNILFGDIANSIYEDELRTYLEREADADEVKFTD